jgi:tetratricopeptide (TPR) repeat protein
LIQPPPEAIDPDATADSLRGQAHVMLIAGQKQRALVTFEAALAGYEAQGDELAQAEMWNNVAVVRGRLGQWNEAHRAFDRAEALFLALQDISRRGQVIANRGDLYAAQGQPQAASDCYTAAAALLEQARDRERAAQAWRALSLLLLRRRQPLAAMSAMAQSLSVRPRLSVAQRFFRLLLRLALGGVGRS